MTYRDTFKTAGEIRAAAFRVSHPEYGKTVDAAELHDSLCMALPSHPDTPASVSRHANTLLHALKVAEAFMAGFEGDETQDGVDALLGQTRSAIAQAEGRA
jgi:hypothetical protein